MSVWTFQSCKHTIWPSVFDTFFCIRIRSHSPVIGPQDACDIEHAWFMVLCYHVGISLTLCDTRVLGPLRL